MSAQLVVFTLNAQHYALPLARVRRVVRTVEVTPLPKAPEIVLGVIDLQGSIIPVMSMRKRFGLSEPETSLSDQLIVADTNSRSVVIVVNSVIGVIEQPAGEITRTETIVPGAEYVEGMAKLEEGILFIYDLDSFLSPQEDQQLDRLLAHAAGKE